MNKNIFKLIELLVNLGSAIFFSAVVCFILGYKLFDLNNFGFQFLIFSILASFLLFTIKYAKIFELYLNVFFWGFVFAYLFRRTSLLSEFGGFVKLLFYMELLVISFSLTFQYFWKKSKIHLRGLFFSLLAAVVYAFIHLLMHLLLTREINGSQLLHYFSNGLVVMLTISLSLICAEFISRSIHRNFLENTN